jgi:hypothetical protein
VAASTVDGVTPVVLEADPTTHSLAVSASVSPASDTTQTGSITGSGQSVTFAVNAQSTVGIQASGTFSGTILIKGSVDGSTYTPTTATSLSTGGLVSTITSSFTGQVNVAGFVSFQLTSVSWTSGIANISLRASTGISNIMLDNSLPAGTNTIGAVTQATGTNLHTVVDSGTVTANISGSISNTSFASTQSGTWNTGTPSATININQTTSAVTATQLTASSIAMTNGVVIQALSTNTASVFIGNSGVTLLNGFELTAGSSLTISPSNINLVYVIGANATDKVCWSVT